LGLEEVVFLCDAVTQEELRKIFQKSAVFVLPCLIAGNGDRDGIPNVLVEAMAMGIPVVSTNISGIPELVGNRRNGLLVPEKDATALAEAIGELLRNPALGQRLGAAAREKVCRFFNAKKNTLALKELFISCLEADSREAE
jgi:glycosyltransferase involved in cell wall biosynthesis